MMKISVGILKINTLLKLQNRCIMCVKTIVCLCYKWFQIRQKLLKIITATKA